VLFWYHCPDFAKGDRARSAAAAFFGGRSRLGAELRPVRERESSDFVSRSGLRAGLRAVCKSSNNEIGLPRTCQCAPQSRAQI